MEQVPDHKHCRVCGAVVGPKDKTCSTACAEIRARQLRNQRLYQLVFIGVSLLLVILFLSVAK